MNKDGVLLRLREQIKNLLISLEKQTGLSIKFESFDSHIVAEYQFIPSDTAIIRLRDDWQDVDVAHELMHMKMELMDGFSVLAWCRNVQESEAIKKAFGRVRCYVDDEVVHGRLVQEGYRIDGEVIKSNLFDDLYTKVPRYLNQRRLHPNNGMAHLDDIDYGELCRSSFLIQAELLLKFYGCDLLDEHRKKVVRFIKAFRLHRDPEAKRADTFLELFDQNNVHSVEGHKNILTKWAQLEGLDKFVGISNYQHQTAGFILPYP